MSTYKNSISIYNFIKSERYSKTATISSIDANHPVIKLILNNIQLPTIYLKEDNIGNYSSVIGEHILDCIVSFYNSTAWENLAPLHKSRFEDTTLNTAVLGVGVSDEIIGALQEVVVEWL